MLLDPRDYSPFLAYNNHYRTINLGGRGARECVRLLEPGMLYGQTDLMLVQRVHPVAIDLYMPAVG